MAAHQRQTRRNAHARDMRIVARILLEETADARVALHRHGPHPVPFAADDRGGERERDAGRESVQQDVDVNHAVMWNVNFVKPLHALDFGIRIEPRQRIRQRGPEAAIPRARSPHRTRGTGKCRHQHQSDSSFHGHVFHFPAVYHFPGRTVNTLVAGGRNQARGANTRNDSMARRPMR